jgi:tetratricopeptide (TPR) repeat protein
MDPNDASAWYEAGQTWMADGDLIRSREAFLKAIDLKPDNPSYYIYLGHSYRIEQRFDQAENWYQSALQINPANAWALSSLADVRMAQRRYQEALDLTLRAMAYDDRAYLPAKAATALMELEDWKEARKYLAISLELEPDNLTYAQRMAVICENLQDRVCLNDIYTDILKIDPGNSLVERKLDDLKGSAQ